MADLLTATAAGWPAVRQAVFARDGGCIAVQRDIAGDAVAPDPCRDKWGRVVPSNEWSAMTLDHVKEQPPVGTLQVKKREGRGFKAPDDEAHLVTVCWGHHVGAQSWATSHRAVEREWLTFHYPEVWL